MDENTCNVAACNFSVRLTVHTATSASMPPRITTLKIALTVREDDQNISAALEGLPGYVTKTFQAYSKTHWSGEFKVSCPSAPHLAEGDFRVDLAPYFPKLLDLLEFYEASFELHIAVGAPAPDTFELGSNMVAMLAALGAPIMIVAN
jgi:hypothetical protein